MRNGWDGWIFPVCIWSLRTMRKRPQGLRGWEMSVGRSGPDCCTFCCAVTLDASLALWAILTSNRNPGKGSTRSSCRHALLEWLKRVSVYQRPSVRWLAVLGWTATVILAKPVASSIVRQYFKLDYFLTLNWWIFCYLYFSEVETSCSASVAMNNTFWQSTPSGLNSGYTCAINIQLNSAPLTRKYPPICQIRLVPTD